MCPEMGTFARLEPRYKSIFSPVHCSALRAMYEPAIKCAFHPDGDEDEEDEEEGEFGRDDVPVCYSTPAGKVNLNKQLCQTQCFCHRLVGSI